MGRKNVKKIILTCIGLYIMIASSLYLLQEKIMFMPTVLEQDYRFDFKTPFEELFLRPDAETVINALHFKVDQPKGVLLYFHGNAGDLSRWGVITEYFVQMQYDVLVMDYRTYGKSTGALSEEALYKDAQFCYEYLKTLYPEDQITVYGRSLGTAMATYVASKNNPKQLVLETPFYSIQDVASHRFPLFPVKYLLQYKFPSYQYIEAVNCPVTIFHGTEDRIVPFESGRKLYDASSKSQTTFVTIEHGKHNDLINFDVYHQNIKTILP